MLTDESLVEDSAGRERWMGHVKAHRLRISRYAQSLDIGQFYGVPLVESLELPEAIENDYAIENRRAEIKQRVKQSLFRKRVFDNFDAKCCLTGIDEPALLVASHIVPWSQRIDSRLDPANGLCLFVLYDALFDAGYFSLTDDLSVVVSSSSEYCVSLAELLRTIDGQAIRMPCKVQIKAEYLSYHRDKVFRKSLAVQIQ